MTRNNTPVPVLAFDDTYKLAAVFKSIKEASDITGIVRQSIMKAVYGKMISIHSHYWRPVPDDLIVDFDDIGKLTLFEFDKTIGEDRRIYSHRKMLRTNIILESEYIKKNKL